MPDHYYKEKKKSQRDLYVTAANATDTNLTNKPRIIGDKGNVQRSLDQRKSRINENYKKGKDVQEFKQGDKTLRLETAEEPKFGNSRFEKRKERVYNRKRKRLQKKDDRLNRRASLVAIRKGMSPDQAKDFIKNRRERFNAATKEYFKGLVGGEQNLDNIKDRYFRKDGSGTIQNVKAADGTTYDATGPHQGEGSDYTGRGQVRKTVPDNYLKFNAKVNKDIPSTKINYKDLLDPVQGDNSSTPNPVKEQNELNKNKTKDLIKTTLDITPTNDFSGNLSIPDNPVSDTFTATTPDKGEKNYAKKLFEGPIAKDLRLFSQSAPSFATPKMNEMRNKRLEKMDQGVGQALMYDPIKDYMKKLFSKK